MNLRESRNIYPYLGTVTKIDWNLHVLKNVQFRNFIYMSLKSSIQYLINALKNSFWKIRRFFIIWSIYGKKICQNWYILLTWTPRVTLQFFKFFDHVTYGLDFMTKSIFENCIKTGKNGSTRFLKISFRKQQWSNSKFSLIIMKFKVDTWV